MNYFIRSFNADQWASVNPLIFKLIHLFARGTLTYGRFSLKLMYSEEQN